MKVNAIKNAPIPRPVRRFRGLGSDAWISSCSPWGCGVDIRPIQRNRLVQERGLRVLSTTSWGQGCAASSASAGGAGARPRSPRRLLLFSCPFATVRARNASSEMRKDADKFAQNTGPHAATLLQEFGEIRRGDVEAVRSYLAFRANELKRNLPRPGFGPAGGR
jgi:hypothetical protein